MSLRDKVEVEVEDNRVQRLLINTRWKDHGTPEELAEAISQAIKAAMPQQEPSDDTDPQRPRVRHMSVNELREYMAMHRAYSRRALEFSRRAVRGEFRGEASPGPAPEGQNVDVRFSAGRFDRILLNPTWASRTATNSIMEAILRVLDGVDLVAADPGSDELAALRDERARVRDFARA
ncbi:hypothetical protein GCM10009785_14840 [Brooklawnia cerclae]|uniref:Uncharacterized protein n=1 Tax=Brooklawnia cerclae TaxID=349934 RepID=A0ABX0SLN6_9ACTN|nr:hypothetical protein [Brooklawnia cerclae]NIH57945.1 hypothetical protein [Brooklawnia cerclae]